MSRWFRFYDDAVNDPKVQRLAPELFKVWVNLLCIVSKAGGTLPTIAELAFTLRAKVPKVQIYITELALAGLLDKNEDGTFSPHNWNARQFKSDVSNERVKRHRERMCNVTETVTVTPPETEQIQNTDQSRKKETRAGALVAPWIETDRERFWAQFPNKVGKADAMKAFDKAARKVAPDVLFSALERYAHKTDDRPFCNPSTWLNQERWLDQPAVKPNGRRTVHDAARDLHEGILQRIQAFDEPAPRSIRGGEGEDAIRLLPPRGCERS